MAVCGQNAVLRSQLVDVEVRETWNVLKAILRVAAETATANPDVFAWAATAIGALSAGAEELRTKMDRDLFEAVARRIWSEGGVEYADSLLAQGLGSVGWSPK